MHHRHLLIDNNILKINVDATSFFALFIELPSQLIILCQIAINNKKEMHTIILSNSGICDEKNTFRYHNECILLRQQLCKNFQRNYDFRGMRNVIQYINNKKLIKLCLREMSCQCGCTNR